jgi:hypothetical protein
VSDSFTKSLKYIMHLNQVEQVSRIALLGLEEVKFGVILELRCIPFPAPL